MAKTTASLVLVLFVVAILNNYIAESNIPDCSQWHTLCLFADPANCDKYFEICLSKNFKFPREIESGKTPHPPKAKSPP
ncbi:hypothetical protein TSUD_269860 [Trifolium subterraneum]|uniref:Uncharacterized protein n=1 Tax=Trifolium subterraneum TaxID=3900 RepID=A0A2Z6N2P4_TRISU|nr:hypothetical protein TSUD_269860 [Trifolium subterraneum]